ncbi:MAG: glycoside hydrolase family 43 protein [Williamsia sp.]|nr:glycoside hydrolase family 43 protein [Williamsia sp.]
MRVSNRIFTTYCTALLLCFISIQSTAQIGTDSTHLYLADPAIFHDQHTYYLYGTGAPDGFPVYTSTDMKQWSRLREANGGYALKKGEAFGSAQFWAPQVFSSNNKFYMAYAANERIAIASSDHPAGPFRQQTLEPLEAPVKQIDPFVFTDDDGKKYLYHVRLTNGNRIFVAELTDDLKSIKPETLRECITATEPWENTAHSEWPVAEGPSVLKHKNLYYLVYTTNDFRNPDYAVGYATSSSPYGPWKKWSGNPIISKKTIGQNGTGHGDFVTGKHNRLYYVFHTHNSDTRVSPRRTAIITIKFTKDKSSGIDKLVADEKSFFFPTVESRH